MKIWGRRAHEARMYKSIDYYTLAYVIMYAGVHARVFELLAFVEPCSRV